MKAVRRRWKLLLSGLPAYFLILLGTSFLAWAALLSDSWQAFFDAFEIMLEPRNWPALCIAPAVIAITQFVFLIPAIRFRRGRSSHGRSLIASIALLSLIAAAMTVGFACGLLELFGPWTRNVPSNATNMFSPDLGDQNWFPATFWITLVVGWILWSLVLWRFVRRGSRPVDRLGRLAGIMLGGTIIEALAIAPIDVMVRRRTDCYCNTGTFFALAFSTTAAIWLAGPGVFIAVTSKRRRGWFETHCEECGYDKRGSSSPRCPECGFHWSADAAIRRSAQTN